MQRCQLPITAPGVVTLVATDVGLFQVTRDGFVLREYAPGWTPEEIQHITAAPLIVPHDVQAFRFRT
jgi:acyl CoA:acetate/3-ketoacid CoA transferase beta subunit